MIKSGLKIYKNNIWEVFALLGFISIGLLIGIFTLLPIINSLFSNSLGRIASEASVVGAKLDLGVFINEIQKRLDGLDWANPIRTIKLLFDNNGFFDIVIKSLESCGLNHDQIVRISNVVHDVCHNAIFDTAQVIIAFLIIIAATGLIGFLGVRILIQARSTSNRNVGKFILSFLLNLLSISIVIFLMILSLISISGVGLYFSLIGIFLLMLLLSLLTSILIYKRKDVSFTNLFNLKSIGFLVLTSLIVLSISMAAFILIFIFSDFIAIYIGIPLIIVTNIVIENITIKYVNEFKTIK